MRDDSTYDSIDGNGTKRWVNDDNRLHRLDGPAVIYYDDDKMWYKNGKIHRENGPAIIQTDGQKRWYIHDKEYDKNDSIFDEAREKYPERFI